MTENDKIEDYPLSGVILKLRTECEVLKNCQPYDGYLERIRFKQVIIKYLMELQRYREQEQEEWHRQVMEEMTTQQLMEQEPELFEV